MRRSREIAKTLSRSGPASPANAPRPLPPVPAPIGESARGAQLDRLVLEKLLEPIDAVFAPEARLPVAAERRERIPRRAVDVDLAAADAARDRERVLVAAGPDAAREAVDRATSERRLQAGQRSSIPARLASGVVAPANRYQRQRATIRSGMHPPSLVRGSSSISASPGRCEQVRNQDKLRLVVG